MSELRGLGAIHDELSKLGVTVAAVSTDDAKAAKRVAEKNKLPFLVLSDPQCQVIGAFGLRHAGAGPNGSDSAIPAQILIGRDGRILWQRVAKLIQDRPAPAETLASVKAAMN